MTDGMAVLLHILGDLMAVLMPVVIVAILVVVTIKDKGRVQTMMEDEPGLNLKKCVPGIVMTVGIWLVLIVVGYLFIRWAGR